VLEYSGVHLSYTYAKGTIQVLKEINLRVEEGEFVTVVGTSGCGKSSLLKLAAGTVFPTAGTVRFQGKPVEGTDPARGMMFQDPTLFPWLTVENNVSFGLHMKGVPKRERKEKAAYFLKKVGLAAFAERFSYELSGGMKQRAALARALINAPSLLMMDEPFAALDVFSKEAMQRLVRSIWLESPFTVLFVTHDIQEAAALGTRLIVFSPRPGTILEDISLKGLSDSERSQAAEHVRRMLFQEEPT
jgi:ABC-type nitrate/sulfonate/bicarbonate transport system ATPase subunit